MRDIRPELIDFGKRLQALRMQRGMTQEQLAHKAGLERSYISQAEQARRNTTLITLFKLSVALEVDPAELVSGTCPSAPDTVNGNQLIDS